MLWDNAVISQDTNIPFLNITNDDEWEFVWDIWAEQVQPFAGVFALSLFCERHTVWLIECVWPQHSVRTWRVWETTRWVLQRF